MMTWNAIQLVQPMMIVPEVDWAGGSEMGADDLFSSQHHDPAAHRPKLEDM